MELDRILIVVCDPDSLAETQRQLKRISGVGEVLTARDGLEALGYLFPNGSYGGSDRSWLPNLVVMDWELPRLSAVDTLSIIRANAVTRELPVILLTGRDDDATAAARYLGEYGCCVRKPAGLGGLIHAVNELLEASADSR